MKTARFALTQPCFLQQAHQNAPEYVGASPTCPAVVVLPAETKEHKHLKKLAEAEAPKAEVLKPAFAENAQTPPQSRRLAAADHYSKPTDSPAALPVEGGKKSRTADKD